MSRRSKSSDTVGSWSIAALPRAHQGAWTQGWRCGHRLADLVLSGCWSEAQLRALARRGGIEHLGTACISSPRSTQHAHTTPTFRPPQQDRRSLRASLGHRHGQGSHFGTGESLSFPLFPLSLLCALSLCSHADSVLPLQAQEVHAAIRKWANEKLGKQAGEGLRIIYGGSVAAKNCKELGAFATAPFPPIALKQKN